MLEGIFFQNESMIFFHFKILFLVVISNFSTSKFWTNFHKMFKISHLSFCVETLRGGGLEYSMLF